MFLIETVTVGAGGAANIEFSSIPQDYDDLVVFFSVRTVENQYFSNLSFVLSFNTTNRSHVELEGDGSSVFSATDTFFSSATNGDSATSNTFGNGQIYIPNYSATDRAKSLSGDFVTENNATNARLQIYAGLWNVNDPVTSLGLSGTNRNLIAGSTVSLYGIKSS